MIYYEHYNYSSPPICNCTDGNTSPDCHDQPEQTYFIQSMQYTFDINNGSWTAPMNLWGVMTSDTNFAAVIFGQFKQKTSLIIFRQFKQKKKWYNQTIIILQNHLLSQLFFL